MSSTTRTRKAPAAVEGSGKGEDVDVGSTTRIDALDRPPHTPIANVIQFFHRSMKRNEQSLPEYQKMYDEGIQVALKYFGE